MGKDLMEIIAYDSNEYSGAGTATCTVQINPESYTHEHTVNYNNQQALGSPGTTLWFKGIPPEKVSFDIYFDATGAVKSGGLATFAKQATVQDQIKTFKDVCFTYNGSIHESNYLIISWGTLVFKCKLTSLNISYTLFKNDGTPLRAKVTASFEEAIDEGLIAKEANNQSPDLTHLVEIKEGDTLPLICYRIYGDSSYYMEVATFNNILNFREIKPGTKIYLPPLK